ncbi:MAG: hypothetical protein GX061_04540 [Eubacteriaceae bacterium]|nr:hypothetical protein [Eubacteriaceae bacterium]
MDTVLFNKITPELDIERISSRWQVRKSSPFYEEIEETREYAAKLMTPKAIIRRIGECKIDEMGVEIDNIRLNSPSLAEILKDSPAAYLYAATGGERPEDKEEVVFDSLWSMYLGDAIFSAIDRAREYAQNDSSRPVAFANPGDIEDWALSENGKILELLGDIPALLGVSAGEEGLLRPLDSVCGIFYAK